MDRFNSSSNTRFRRSCQASPCSSMKSTKPWKKSTPESAGPLGPRESDPNRAIVLRPRHSHAVEARDSELRLDEACGLAAALDLDVVHREIIALRKLEPGTYFGSGRVETLKDEIAERDAGVVIVDTALSP